VDPEAFPGTIPHYHWTSTSDVHAYDSPGQTAWYVHFNWGTTGTGYKFNSYARARCVRESW